MLVGIHKELYGKFSRTLEIYEEILKFNKINSTRVDLNDLEFWNNIRKLDLFIFRWSQYDDYHQQVKTILPIIENEMNINCFPNMDTCWHYDDKIKQYYLMKINDFPFIDSWVFWDKKQALNWFNSADLPIVFKLKGGAGSINVILIKSRQEGIKIIKSMFGKGIKNQKINIQNALQKKFFNIEKKIKRIGGDTLRYLKGEDSNKFWQLHKNYVYFQKYLPSNEFDTRITIIGKRAFGFRRFVRRNDFRASGSGNIDYSIKEIDIRDIQIAFEITKKMKFQTMAFDFIYNLNSEPEICEISYNYKDDAIFNCPGYWDDNFIWHEGHFWPQYFHLVDTLKLDLSQPEIIF